MQKKTKKIAISIILIIILIIILSLIITKPKQTPQPISEQAKAQYTTTIGDKTFDITNAVTETPNSPKLSAGMIPIKWDIDTEMWTITTLNDNTWYDYSIGGHPAYMMLNDGTYQSELIRNMTNKKLAQENIGKQIQTTELGSIYVWFPRFAYNDEGEILYIKQGYTVVGTWTTPDMFAYETEKVDFSLSGVWIEYNVLANSDAVTTKIGNMNKEENNYGLIANTIGVSASDDTENKIGIQKYSTYLNEIVSEEFYNSVGSNGAILNSRGNLNRTILKVTNANEKEPIKAKANYNTDEEKVKIEVTYKTNEIVQILDEDGNALSENSTTADTGETPIGNGIYKYIIIDNLGNQKKVKTPEITGLDIYIIKDRETLYAFRDAVNAGKTTASTKAYQVADVKLNEGKYTKNGATGECTFQSTAEQWTPIASFSGTYDGKRHTISGLYMNTTKVVGFIEKLNGTVKNLGIINGLFITTGNVKAGGIVIQLSEGGNIENCYNGAKISSAGASTGGVCGYMSSNVSTSIKNCYNAGNINGRIGTGGICGEMNGNGHGTMNITDCYNTGTITGTSSETGGICGYTIYAEGYGTIQKSYNSGDVIGGTYVGGIVGKAECSIKNCYNNGTINGTGSSIGGIAGWFEKNILINCYNTGTVSTTGTSGVGIGGICGRLSYPGTVKNTYNLGKIGTTTTGTYTGGIVGSGYNSTTEVRIYNSINIGEVYAKSVTYGGAIVGDPNNTKISILSGCGYLSGRGTAIYAVSKSKEQQGSREYTTLESVPSVLSIVNGENAFLADTENINNGYPIFAWQQESKK